MLTASGRIEPRADVDVGAQVSGRLEALNVDVGDRVAAGQLLALIDAEVQAAQIEALEASLAGLQADRTVLEAELGFAERQVGRHTTLRGHASTLVTLEEAERDRDMLRARIDSLDAAIRRSEAELRAEQAVLERARITAPMAGTVTAIEARVGQTLNANYDTPVILRIADLSAMTVRSEVSEADIVHLTPGMPVRFTTLGRPDQPIEASLRRILPAPPVTESESSSNSVVSYIALFDVDNASGALMPGMTAQVFFVTESAKDALAVPVAALEDDGSLRVLRPDGTAETRHPETGMRTRAHVEILSGVAEGEQVITGTRPAGPPSPLRIVP